MKKKGSKYCVAQVGGKAPFVQSNTYATNGTEDAQMNTSPFDSIASANPDLVELPDNHKTIGLFDSTRTQMNPWVSRFNAAARITTGIASKVNDVRATQNEYKQYLDALQPEGYENMERYGLNNNPVYSKYGGEVNAKYQVGGQTPPRKLSVQEMSEWNMFLDHVKGKGLEGSPTLNTKDKNLGQSLFDEFKKTNPNVSIGYDIVPAVQQAMQELRGNTQSFLKRKGQPDAEQVMSGISPVDGWFGSKTSQFRFPSATLIQEHNGQKVAQRNLGLVDSTLTAAASRGRALPQGVTPEDLYDAAGNKTGMGYTDPRTGDVVQLQKGGVANNLIEAEKGEVFQDVNGEIGEISDNAPTHEQGGVIVPDVHKVLENTSSLRNDKTSRYLRLSPQEATAITGVQVNRPVSHAEALTKANDKLEEQRNKIVGKIQLASKDRNHVDKYGELSTKLNIDHIMAIPSEQQVFDKLFQHQEAVKAEAGITPETSKFQLGGYPGSKNKLKTPAGNPDSFPKNMKFEDYLKELESSGFKYEGIKSNADLQKALYQYKVDKGEFDDIRNMWKEGMHITGMTKAKEMGFVDDKGLFKQGVLDKDDNLKKLGELYPDGMLGPRLLKLAKGPRIWTDDDVPKTPAAEKPVQDLDTSITNDLERVPSEQSKFHEPLRWYDVASPINAFMASLERIPEKYNPAQFNQLRYKLQDPTAALQQNQADFNATSQAIQSTTGVGDGVKMANLANLTSQKYALNNQVLGNTENQNSQIKNNEITYNTQVRDKQSVSDQQSREVFENKVLTSKAKQQEQKLTALDSLYKTMAENRALNRNGNLIMKFSRAFDQYGDYNGYQHIFGVNPSLGLPTDPATTTNSGKYSPYAGGIQGLVPGKSYYNRRTGKTLYFDGNNLRER